MPPPDFRAYEIHIGPATQAIAKLWTQRGDDAPPETQITFDLTTEQLHRLKSLAMPLMDYEKAFLSEPFVGGELVSLTIALGERSTTIPPGLSHQQATSLVPLYRAVMETVPSASRALFPRWQLADATPRFEH